MSTNNHQSFKLAKQVQLSDTTFCSCPTCQMQLSEVMSDVTPTCQMQLYNMSDTTLGTKYSLNVTSQSESVFRRGEFLYSNGMPLTFISRSTNSLPMF